MRWPAKLPQGKLIHQPAITMDLTATFLAAAGAAPPSGRTLDGINLLPILTGQEPPRERTFCWRVNRAMRQQKAIRHGDWKYVLDGGVDLLFNLQDDISERRDLGYQNQAKLADLKSRLQAWEVEIDRSPPAFLVR
jgi:arylsulfatase A-like enzyme